MNQTIANAEDILALKHPQSRTSSHDSLIMTLSPRPDSIATMKAREGERKEIDSPMTTQTDVSSSYDEQSLMTPPPMPSRLGRIVISSNGSSTDGSGSYVITDGEDESRTSSYHRRLKMRPCANRKLAEEAKNESQALTNALHQLQRLATLDSAEYQQRLLENSLPALQTEKPKSSPHRPTLADSSTSSSSSSTAQEISQLPQSVQTPLVQLSMSIHRLHAVVANITREVDGHTDEVQELQSQLAVLRRRNKQVESAAKKVHKKNLKLQQQAKHDRRIAHGLEQKVQEYEAQLESQGFQLMASKVQNHEIQLQLSKTQSRERMDSNMSDFFDIEAVDSHDDEDSNCNTESMQTTSTTTSTVADSPARPNALDNEDQHVRSGNFDNFPIIRFSKEGLVTPDRTSNRSSENSSSSNSTVTTSTTDEVNHGESDGSPRKMSSIPSKEKPAEKESFSNRFAKFLGPRTIPNYNLKLSPPCNIQFVEIPLHPSMNEIPEEKESLNNKEVVEDHGILVPMHDGSTRSLDADGLSLAPKTSPSSFAVCGLHGFNTAVNMKPTMGAQLTKINGKAIDEQWTLQTLYSDLEKHGKKKQIVLTFRNERWDAEQTKILNAAIREIETKGASHSDQEKEKADGASLFESPSKTNGSDDQKPQTDGEMDPPPRARTASADSVGKAIHGIGNFLHSLHHPEDSSTS